MFTRGEFTSNNVTYGVIMNYTKACIEAILVTSGTVVSAYKTDATGSYSYNNVRAKELVQLIKNGVKGCTSKNGTPMPFELGAMTQHEFTKTKVEYIMQMHKGEVVGAYIQSGDKRVELTYNDQCEIPANIPYIKLTEVQVKKELDVAEDDLDAVPVRSVQEIALEKDDLTWLQNKKYYIVNDDETAEKLFTFLDNYNGAIAYDTETTGLRINCFGKINSEYSKSLQKYNEEHPDEQIRSDRLVGIIFCVENDTSYYFPCFNRKFKNLYEDIDSPIRNKIINNIKTRYTIGDRRDSDGDMRDYVLNTPADQFRLDVILMERVRDILHTKHIVAHNGTFEWKVGWQYEIDTNLTDDTMIMHQLMYKFRSTTSNRGEPSNLKYLAKRELGIDQWELSDFFPDWKADSTGTVRTKAGAKAKKSGSRIDFSYMDYEGTRVYAPTDGDVTFLLYNLYKKDMKKNHADMEYIYSVEIIVSCAIAYMEFYGHRLDESKILGAREQTRANIAMIVSEIRQLISYSNNDEVIAYNNLKQLRKDIDAAKGDEKVALEAKLPDMVNSLNSAIDANTDKVINLASPAQVCDLFYNKMKIPVPGDKQSVAKKEIKALLKEKDENGKDKYPIVHMYSKYKNEDTLMTKFFDNLPYFMYPGGYIFSSFGQISTATGRMSCIDENSLITTVGGYKKIKDMQAGDLVYCYDEEGNLRIKKVLNVMDKGMKECVKLHWESTGTHTSGELICTPDHKILSKNSGWVRADSLSYNEPVYHLRRSSEDRPRLYGTNSICEQEQLVIKKEIFKTDNYNMVIHHKDEVTTNNDPSNLELKTRKEHSSEHSKELASQGRLKYEHLAEYAKSGEFVLHGEEHPCYIKKSAEELEQMLINAEYIVTKIPMDFSTYVKKCEEAGFDYKDALAKNRKEFKEVDREEFVNTYNKHNGVVYAIAKDLGIGRARVATLIRQYGLEASIENIDDEAYITIFKQCNGDVNKMQNECESIGVKLTTSEIRKNNTRLGLVSIGVDDDTFTEVFLNNKGSIRATAKELGISFYKASCTVKRLNICYNHKIVGIENVGIHHVYDLEVEDCHNFIANEICVHNCSRPNAQQYPKVITKIVSPRPGFVMMDADYSQIEYRVLTALAKNTELAKLFSHPDSDYHTLMASLMYSVPYASVTPQMRSAAKSFNFGIPYGMGIKSLSILLNGKSDKKSCDEAMEKYELYFKNQPRTRKFFNDIKEMAQVNGYTKTLFNRYRYYSFTDKDGNVNNGKRAAALRQAGNAVIQGTAADIFKIGVARNFSFIRRNNLFGKMLIINMIHDEQLMEVDVQHLNMQRILAEVGKNMQFHIDGFPPLYIGAGIGPAWGYAKGKMAEIHPLLLEQFTKEAESIPIYREDCSTPVDTKEVLDYFQNRVYEFRRKKVADYLADPANWHQDIHPAIGGLINLQFNYGRGDDAKAYVGPNGEKYNDTEFLLLNIADFLKENNIDAKPEYFTAQEQQKEVEEDNSYDDSDEEEPNVDDMVDDSAEPQIFSKIDESNKLFGASLHDYIGIFGTCILEKSRVCGIDTRNLHFRKRDAIIAYLMNYICDEDDPDGNQIVFLTDGNILKYTGIYVKGLKASELEANYKIFLNNSKAVKGDDSDYQNGDIDNRSQAK